MRGCSACNARLAFDATGAEWACCADCTTGMAALFRTAHFTISHLAAYRVYMAARSEAFDQRIAVTSDALAVLADEALYADAQAAHRARKAAEQTAWGHGPTCLPRFTVC